MFRQRLGVFFSRLGGGAAWRWKAPAGTEAGLAGATLATNLTDLENGSLNTLGVNVLRSFPVFGTVGWGARTLAETCDLLEIQKKNAAGRQAGGVSRAAPTAC